MICTDVDWAEVDEGFQDYYMISATVLYRNAVLGYNNHALLKLILVYFFLFYVFITWVAILKYNLIIWLCICLKLLG